MKSLIIYSETYGLKGNLEESNFTNLRDSGKILKKSEYNKNEISFLDVGSGGGGSISTST